MRGSRHDWNAIFDFLLRALILLLTAVTASIQLFCDETQPFQRNCLAPLARLTTLRTLGLSTRTRHFAPAPPFPCHVLPYLPGVTTLHMMQEHAMSDVAQSMPNRQHLHVAHSTMTESYEPLSRLTSLTSLLLDDCEEVERLPPNLDMVRSLRHLCVHARLSGTSTMRRQLGGCSAQTVCEHAVFVPGLFRPPFRVVKCPFASPM